MDRLSPWDQHIQELRYRLTISFLAFLLGLGLGWWQVPHLLDYLLARFHSELVFTQPIEAFSGYFTLAALVGLILALPVFLYQMILFVRPGLLPHERRILYWSLPVSVLLFFAGASFGFFFILPFAWRFLLGFGSSFLQPLITFSSFISFLLTLTVPLGLIFQWPLLVAVLSYVEIVSPSFLRRGRKVAILAALVVAGTVTPPDILSQVLVATPLVILYEVSILVADRLYGRRQQG
ncbi:MAG: twin-arginine translocase subunit TatC [Bacillota bacterium]|nr:twin-arginine translocase subunit TatC [Bacillota bacterium]